MKIAIVYSSNTGNTKMLAETIKNALSDKDIAYFGKVNDGIPDSDLYIIGSWTNKGNASLDIQNFLNKLRNKKIAYFATAGYGGSDPHFEDIISDLNMTLNWDNAGDDLPRCYIMLRKDKVTPIREFLNDKHRVDIITFDEYSQMKDFLKDLADEYPRSKTI